MSDVELSLDQTVVTIDVMGAPGPTGPTGPAGSLAAGTLTGALEFADYVSLASETAPNLGATNSNLVLITGTTTITGFATAAAGKVRWVRFASALTLTHNSVSLILPGAVNITTATNDTAMFVSLGSGNWICTAYKKANGKAVVLPVSADITGALGYTPTSVTGLTGTQSVSAFKTGIAVNNLDNTSDLNKPISTATQTALDLKAPLASPALTGNPTAPTQTAGNNSTRIATTAYTDAADALKLNLSGGTLTGALTLSGDPTNNLHAATKQYVDNVAQGLDAKTSVRVATTANITLSAAQTIDGVSATVGDRVLVKNQSTTSQNGIYIVASGSWTRATDMDAWTEFPGSFVFVEEGTTNGDTGWVCTSNAGGTLGSTSVTWTQFSGAGSYSAGSGLTLTGTQFSVDSSVVGIRSSGLNQFSATTSAQLAGVISDETGSGSLVFATSPTLVTPNIGSATGTSLRLSGNGSLSLPTVSFANATGGMGLKLDGVTQMGVVVNSTSIAGFYALGFFTVSGMRISPNGGNEYMISNNAGEFDVYAGAIHVQRWTSNSIEARKLIDLQSGQVKFPATQIASSDPNTLDDYEEGTFTPTITFGGAAVGVTYGASNGGTYTKVGNRVMVSGLLQVSAKGSSTGSAVLGGLPFSSADAIQGAPSFRFGNLSGVTGMQGYVTGTTIILETLAAAAITNSAFGSGNDVITFTVTYRV